MNEATRNTNIPAKDRILEAAYEEFGHNGYQNASTNRIAQSAGVAKGSIFHHFTSKQGLYMACLQSAAQLIMQEIQNQDFTAETDLFQRIFYIARIKIEFCLKFRNIYLLLADAYEWYKKGDNKEIKFFFDKSISSNMVNVLEGIDTSRFRKDVDKEGLIEFAFAVLRYYSDLYISAAGYDKALDSESKMMVKLEQVADLIQYGIYQAKAQDQTQAPN